MRPQGMKHLPRHDIKARLRWANSKLATFTNLLRIDVVGPDDVVMLLGVAQHFDTMTDFQQADFKEEHHYMGNILLDWECNDDVVVALGQLLMRTLYKYRHDMR